MHDKNDPICHDIKGEEAQKDAMQQRSLAWVGRQPDDVKLLFCEHGRYVGFGKVFAYKCERCNPGYED
jgi:hypothetical protein